MVDRGGLNYPIRVRDEFSKTTALFRKELRASKKEFRDFQKVVSGQRSAAKDIREQAKATLQLAIAQRKLEQAKRATIKPLSDEERAANKAAEANRKLARAIDLQARAQRDRERRAVALRNTASRDAAREQARLRGIERQAAAERKLAQSKDEEFQATKRINAELFRERVLRAQIQQLRNRALASTREGDLRGGLNALKRSRELERSLKGQLGTAQKLLFTFRRLVGVLAIFTLARVGVQQFNLLVRAGVQFNDTVENAQLGIAGLVVTLGDVRNAQGQSVAATEQLGLALGLAREQTALLRQDSLRTVATFEQLLDTFQVSVGPGLAAGLNLDEVRKLTVDISQAAAALGIPQNQLAEEVRSLLSGTIQARTTRIATALGISNEDIRRLKEAGTLVEFLEERFSGFAEAAQKQARETFSGISTLVRGLVQEVLGQAARPLFDELIALGNQLFDNFLSIRDAAGNIRPAPAVVAAFQQVFDAIKRSVEALRELGGNNALSALDSLLAGVAVTIDFISGAVGQIVALFTSMGNVLREVAQFLGLTSRNTGEAARFAGRWLVNVLLIVKAVRTLNVQMLTLIGRIGLVAGIFFGIGKAVEQVVERIFGVDLTLRDTIQLVSLGLLGAFFEVSRAVQSVAQSISNFFGGAIDTIVSKAKSGALRGLGFVQSAFFQDDIAAQSLEDRAFLEEKELKRSQAARENANKLELADIKAQSEAKLKAVQDEIAAIVAARQSENNRGEGFRDGFDPAAAAKAAADAANAFVSVASRSVSDLGESLSKVNDELNEAQLKFEQSQRSSGAGGVAGNIESVFNDEELKSAERLRKVNSDLANVQREIVRLRELGPPAEGALNSALKDQELLQLAILNAEEQSLMLAALRAATISTEALPALREEAALLQAQAAAEAGKTALIRARAGDTALALQAAQSAVALADQELAALQRKNALEQESLRAQAAALPPGAELNALNEVIAALAVRQGFEEEILSLRREQLLAAQQEAELVANGSLTDGLREGFMQFSQEFSSTFNAGIAIARTAVEEFSQFASQAIIDAFDPTKEVDIVARFLQLLQQIAQAIIAQLIELAIAKALIRKTIEGATGEDDSTVAGAAQVGAVRIATETTVASIKLANALAIAAIKAASGGGFSEGGQVGLARGGVVPHFGPQAQGLARGGRPSHIPASDTVPAWLTPGEFVVNKASTSQFLPLLQAMNGGSMPVVGSSSAEAAGPSTGMASGGLVADRLAARNAQQQDTNSQSGMVVVPAIVARDGELDRLTAGGKNAMFAFMRENAGTLNTLLDRGNGRN